MVPAGGVSKRVTQIRLVDDQGAQMRSYHFEYHFDGNGPP